MTVTYFDLNEFATRHFNLPYIISESGRLTFGQFIGQVNKATAILTSAGVHPGDRVIVAGQPDISFPVWIFALMQAGAIAAPVNPQLPAAAIENIIRKITARQIITPQTLFQDLAEVKIGHIDYDLASESLSQKPQLTGDLKPIPLEQQATIVFTSGSTAAPNAVLHTLANHYFSALGANKNIPLGVGDRWLISLPVFHVGGLAVFFRALISGASVVFPGKGLSTGKNVEKFNITHLSLVSTQLSRLLNESISFKKYRQIKSVLIGGGPVVKNLIAHAREHGLPIYSSYGSTEMASQITTTRAGDTLAQQCTSGTVLEYRELRISNEKEVQVRGKTLFEGYVDGTKLLSQLNEDAWFPTGDLGFLDQDGYLTITGRRDNMFISGGENIYPEEIEQAVTQIDIIEQALVVPVPHRDFGSQAVAIIKTKEGKKMEPDILIFELKKNLPGYKIPKIFLNWPEKFPDGLKPEREWYTAYARKQVGKTNKTR